MLEERRATEDLNIKDKIPALDCCSIIGNGPTATDMSDLIDASYVMRCNYFALHKNTGTRIDLNINSLYNHPSGRYYYPIFGILPIDYIYKDYAYDMSVLWQRHAHKLSQHGNEVWTYGQNDDFAEVFNEVAGKIKAFPTTGIMAIATARWKGAKSIIVSGFSFFKIGFVKPIAAHHNPDAEIALLRHWIETDDREYILDRIVKKVLYDYR